MTEKINFNNLPEAVEQLQSDIAEIRELITAPAQKANRLMVLPEAASLLSLSKPSIYRLVSDRSIPFHKQGGKLYFIEAELIDWVKTGRR